MEVLLEVVKKMTKKNNGVDAGAPRSHKLVVIKTK